MSGCVIVDHKGRPCGNTATRRLLRVDGAPREVCDRCAEELLAMWGYRDLGEVPS